MARCRNPECVNGLCPGVKILSKGKTGAPLFGEGGTHKADPMRWSWVNCLACSAKPKDPPYKHIVRSEDERKQRAAWASEGVPYKPDSETAARLSRVASKANGKPTSASASPDNSELMSKIDKLVEGQAELLDQIKELRTENKALKAENERLKSATVAN